MKARELAELIELGGTTLFKHAGIFKLRRSFFYRHGFDSEMLAEKLRKRLDILLKDGDISGYHIIADEEVWQAWPKDSWWEVRFEIQETK